jgi:hypothetical protein
MLFNTCCTAATFRDPEWMKIHAEFHRDLKERRPEDRGPFPSILDEYWNNRWKDAPESCNSEYLSAENLHRNHRPWEYIQTLASIYHGRGQDLRGKRILGLGAGVESPLWTLSRWGADVTATDIYFEKKYWHPEFIPHIRGNPEIFCPYHSAYPVHFRNLNAKIRRLRNLFEWLNLGKYDVAYSISSLEHIHGTQRRERSMPERIMRKKISMFRRIARHVAAGGILCFTTELIVTRGEKRRLDFYERADIERIVAELGKCSIELIEPVDWASCAEQAIPTRGMEGCTHTALALTFRRAGSRSV